MSVKLTSTYWKIRALTKPIRVIQGGQASSKTFSILIILFQICSLQGKTTSTIITETYPQLKDGVIADFRSIFEDAGWNFDAHYNRGDKDLKFPNGSLIQFRNIDNKDFHKAKGARRDYLFINEANRIAYNSVDQMITRTNKGTFIDFNPDREFWVHTELLTQDRLQDDVAFISVTYKDNEKIPEGEYKHIARRIAAAKKPDATDSMKNWVRIYADGQLGSYSERRIYQYQIIKEIPPMAMRINSGMDFGTSPDQTVLVDLYIDGIDLICDERFAENNLMPEKIEGAERQSVVDKMQEIQYPEGQLIIGDSANKTQITDMRKHKYNILAVKKRPGSIIAGITKVNGYNLKITERSQTLKKGIETWFWKEDKNGKIIPEPDGHEPDGLAAVRYALMSYQRK